MRLSSRKDSFCLVDVDDLSLRSDISRCLLRLDVFTENGYSHGRIIHLYQIEDKEHQGQISYPLLIELIQESSSPFVQGIGRMSSGLAIWCTYHDQDGNNVLIGTSEELQYAIKTQGGDDDMLTLTVKIVPLQETPKPAPTLQREITSSAKVESALDTITNYLTAMEERIHKKLSEALEDTETRLQEKILAIMERTIISSNQSSDNLGKKKGELCQQKVLQEETLLDQDPPGLSMDVATSGTQEDHTTTGASGALPSAEDIFLPAVATTTPELHQSQLQQEQAMRLMEEGMASPPPSQEEVVSLCLGDEKADARNTREEPFAATAIAQVATAECRWVQPPTETNQNPQTNLVASRVVQPKQSLAVTESLESEQQVTADTAMRSTYCDLEEGQHPPEDAPNNDADSTGTATQDSNASHDKDWFYNTVIPALEARLQSMLFQDNMKERAAKDALESLKQDVQASVGRLEEWHQTVLDGISVQTKLLKNRVNDRTEKVVRRISQLEACCKDIQTNQKKTNSMIGAKQWKAIERIEEEQSSLRRDIKTLVQAIVKKVDKEDEGSVESVSSTGSSANLSVYTNVPTTVQVAERPRHKSAKAADDGKDNAGDIDWFYESDIMEEEVKLSKRDQKRICRLRVQMAYHESHGNHEEVVKLNEQIASIWAKGQATTDSLILYGMQLGKSNVAARVANTGRQSPSN